MSTNGIKNIEKNGKPEEFAPRWTDYLDPKPLTKEQEELREAFREAMAALKEEERKYGKKDYSNL